MDLPVLKKDGRPDPRPVIRILTDFGAMVILFWIALTFTLAPLWGKSFLEMASIISARADYLISKQQSVSLSIDAFRNAGWGRAYQVGMLYGSIYFSFPVSLLLAMIVSSYRLCRSTKWYLWIFLPIVFTYLLMFLPLVYAYSTSVFGIAWFVIISFLLAKGTNWVLDWFQQQGSRSVSWGNRCMVLLFFIAISLPLTAHPVWHAIFTNDFYKGVLKPTMIRDWYFLDEKGNNLINDFYYENSPYASELDRVTNFQPMVISYIGVEMKSWAPLITAKHIRHKNNQRWFAYPPFKAHHLECSDIREAKSLFEQSKTDLVLLSYKKALQSSESYLQQFNSGALLIISNDLNAPKTHAGHRVITKSRLFNGTYEWNSNYIAKKSIFVERQKQLKEISYDERAMMYFWFAYDFRDKFLGMGWGLALILGLAAVGCGGYAYRGVSRLSGRLILVMLLGALVFRLAELDTWTKYLSTWRLLVQAKNDESNIYILLKQLHLMSHEPREADVLKVIDTIESKDKRVLMWCVEIVGRAYKKLTPQTAKRVREYLRPLFESYHDQPMNLRYKFLETVAQIPEFKPMANEIALKEKHLYVRWYAEKNGLGIAKLN